MNDSDYMKHLEKLARGHYHEPIDFGDPREGAGALAWAFGACIFAVALWVAYLIVAFSE